MAGMHRATVRRLLKSDVVVSPFLLRNTLSIEARNFGFEIEPKNTFESNSEVYVSRIYVRCIQTGEKFGLEYRQWK